mgnify:CR=1 FL=1
MSHKELTRKKIVVNRSLRQNGSGLKGMTQRIKLTATWADLKLPTEVVRQLRKVCLQVNRWGRISSRESEPGKRRIILLRGRNNACRTQVAAVIANELHMNLYVVNLSAIISKYSGEIEKNLSKLFDKAETDNWILLFEETDELFGKRSEVKNAHERYSSGEISYLLQQIQCYNRIAIISTNVDSDFDEAFWRRFDLIVTLPPNTDE